VRQTARRMADDGQLDTDGRGRYLSVTAVTAVTFPGQDLDHRVTATVTDVTSQDVRPEQPGGSTEGK